MPASWEALLPQARAAFTAQFGGEPTVLGCAPGASRASGQPHRLQRRPGHGRGHRSLDGRGWAVDSHGREATSSSRSTSARPTTSRSTRSSAPRPGPGPATSAASAGPLTEWSGPLASGFEAVDRGRRPARGGTVQLGEPPGVGRLVLDPARPGPGPVEPGLRRETIGDLHRMELAKTLRRSENEFVGVGSGLLDQFSSLFGRADHALFLDCDTLVHDRLPLGSPAPAIVVCDSKTSRRLADGMYDQRRAECDRVASVFRRSDSPPRRVPALVGDARAARGRLGRPRPGRPQASPARPERE